jgi:hypothetical protein
MTDYPVKATREIKKCNFAGSPIYFLDDKDITVRCNPKDINEKGFPTTDISNQYARAEKAIYEVQQSCLHLVLSAVQ